MIYKQVEETTTKPQQQNYHKKKKDKQPNEDWIDDHPWRGEPNWQKRRKKWGNLFVVLLALTKITLFSC